MKKVYRENLQEINVLSFEEAKKDYFKSNVVPFHKKYHVNSGRLSVQDKNKIIKSSGDFIKKNEYGNVIKIKKRTNYINNRLSKAYDRYSEELLDIFHKYVEDVEGYFYCEEWLLIFLFSSQETYDELIYSPNYIALPIALFLLDKLCAQNKLSDVARLVENVEIKEDFLEVSDPLYADDLIYKVSQVIFEHNKDNKKFKEGEEFYGDEYSLSSSTEIYRNLLELVGDEVIQDSINKAKNKGIELFENIIRMLQNGFKNLTSTYQKADLTLNNIKTYKETPIQFKQIPSIDEVFKQISENRIIRDYKNDVSTTSLGISLINQHVSQSIQCEMLEKDIFDASKKYYLLNDFRKNNPDFKKRYEDNELLQLSLNSISIQNPYEIIAGLVFALDYGEDYPHLLFIYSQLCLLCQLKLPWRLLVTKEIEDLIPEDNSICFDDIRDTTDNIVKNEDLKETNFNYAQLMYQTSGSLLPRNILNNDFVTKLTEVTNIETDYKDNIIYTLLWMSQVKSEHLNNKFEFDKKEIENTVNSIDDKNYKNQIKQLKKELNEKVSEGYRSATLYSEKCDEYNALKDQYEKDMQELAELRNMMFAMQYQPSEEKTEEDLQLPYKTKKNVVIFGGHETWISSIKENLEGNIKFYPSKVSLSKQMISNADIIFIQTSFISHTTYYGVVDMAKRNNIPFKCISGQSVKKALKIIIENDI